jgi:hypothetical protein
VLGRRDDLRSSAKGGAGVSEPFVYVGTWTIRPGKFEEAKRFFSEHADVIEKSEPRLIAFHVYFDEDGGKGSVVHADERGPVAPNAAAEELGSDGPVTIVVDG